jgi:hypothetical protein
MDATRRPGPLIMWMTSLPLLLLCIYQSVPTTPRFAGPAPDGQGGEGDSPPPLCQAVVRHPPLSNHGLPRGRGLSLVGTCISRISRRAARAARACVDLGARLSIRVSGSSGHEHEINGPRPRLAHHARRGCRAPPMPGDGWPTQLAGTDRDHGYQSAESERRRNLDELKR